MTLPIAPRTLYLRGLTMACPVCGQRGLFDRWVEMMEDCPRCGLHFERVEGHWIGAIGINTIVTFATLALILLVGSVISYPDIAVWPMVIAGLAVALVMPIAFYPVSKTLWTAIDLRMRPLEPDEVVPGYWS